MLKRWKLWAGIIAALLVAFLGLRAFSNSRQSASLSDYQTQEAVIGDLTARVGATGSVHAAQTAMLAFETTGMPI